MNEKIIFEKKISYLLTLSRHTLHISSGQNPFQGREGRYYYGFCGRYYNYSWHCNEYYNYCRILAQSAPISEAKYSNMYNGNRRFVDAIA